MSSSVNLTLTRCQCIGTLGTQCRRPISVKVSDKYCWQHAIKCLTKHLDGLANLEIKRRITKCMDFLKTKAEDLVTQDTIKLYFNEALKVYYKLPIIDTTTNRILNYKLAEIDLNIAMSIIDLLYSQFTSRLNQIGVLDILDEQELLTCLQQAGLDTPIKV